MFTNCRRCNQLINYTCIYTYIHIYIYIYHCSTQNVWNWRKWESCLLFVGTLVDERREEIHWESKRIDGGAFFPEQRLSQCLTTNCASNSYTQTQSMNKDFAWVIQISLSNSFNGNTWIGFNCNRNWNAWLGKQMVFFLAFVFFSLKN